MRLVRLQGGKINVQGEVLREEEWGFGDLCAFVSLVGWMVRVHAQVLLIIPREALECR